ncbi:unnamed protein product [Closterium sp. Naga37s-1]|nr:unnamed protein product [Closterium sp. Naga37s-1]
MRTGGRRGALAGGRRGALAGGRAARCWRGALTCAPAWCAGVRSGVAHWHARLRARWRDALAGALADALAGALACALVGRAGVRAGAFIGAAFLGQLATIGPTYTGVSVAKPSLSPLLAYPPPLQAFIGLLGTEGLTYTGLIVANPSLPPPHPLSSPSTCAQAFIGL